MDKKELKVAPIRLEMLITIVDKKKGEFYADLLQSFDVNMQMIVSAKGTAEAKMLEYLGLSNSEKSVIISMVREDRLEEIEAVLENKFATVKGGKGVALSIPMSSIMGAAAFGFLSNEGGYVK
jgi:predicted class III extradiol MEMO1 family dioxygenase